MRVQVLPESEQQMQHVHDIDIDSQLKNKDVSRGVADGEWIELGK